MTVLAVMTKAADDVVMFLEECALETYDKRNTHFQDQTNKHMRRPFVHFTCVSIIIILELSASGPCQSFKTLKEGHSS